MRCIGEEDTLTLRSIIWMVAGCLALEVLAGCQPQARRKILSAVFDGVTEEPRPPTQRVRRNLLREVEELKQQLAQAREENVRVQQERTAVGEAAATSSDQAKPIEQAKTWEEAETLLPKTDDMPDWVKAVSDGVIAPKPGPDPGAAREPVLPLDVELVPADDPTYAVLFRHEPHTTWLSCTNCHSGIFQMKRGADAITMDKITEGQYCGVCHGKVAFSADACARCHRALAEP